MKTKIIFLILILLTGQLPAKDPRPKIGLALSGGGALGFAHVGILEKIDSLDIPIDYITGTSMGGLVGALYASGYSSQELLKIIKSTDWPALFNDSPPRSQLPYFEKIDDHKYQLKIGVSEAIRKTGYDRRSEYRIVYKQTCETCIG